MNEVGKENLALKTPVKQLLGEKKANEHIGNFPLNNSHQC